MLFAPGSVFKELTEDILIVFDRPTKSVPVCLKACPVI
jgi:hypothetical protein